MATSQVPNTSTGYSATPGSDLANKVAAMSAAAANNGVAPVVTPGIVDQSKLNAAQRQVDIETAAGITGSHAQPVLTGTPKVAAPTVATSAAADTRNSANIAAFNQGTANYYTGNDQNGTGTTNGVANATNWDGSPNTGYNDGTTTVNPNAPSNTSGSTTSTTGGTGTDGAVTSADIVNGQLAANQNAADKAYAEYKSSMDSIMNGTYQLNPEDQAQLQGIKDMIDRTAAAQKLANDAQTSAVTTMGVRSGRQRYAGEINTGIIGAEINAGITRIQDIQSKGASLLSEARQAIDSKNMDQLDRAMKAYNENNTARSNAIQQMYQNTVTAANQQREDARFQMDKVKADTEAHASAIQSSQEGQILGAIDSGVTDPASILQQVNYDDAGNMVEHPVTITQITALQKALKDSKANPGKYETRANPDGGFSQIEYDDTGKFVGVTEIIPPPAAEDPLLSVSEAASLGVPYGTTQSEAASLGLFVEDSTKNTQKLITDNGIQYNVTYDANGNEVNRVKAGTAEESADKLKYKTLIASGKDALKTIRDTLYKNAHTGPTSGMREYDSRPLIASGTYDTAETNLSDIIGRLRSGGAISPEEEKRYLSMLPGRFDSSETVKNKLNNLDTALGPFFEEAAQPTTLTPEEQEYVDLNGGDSSHPDFNNVGGDTNTATQSLNAKGGGKTVPTSMSIASPVIHTVASKYPVGSKGGQCGHFVNQALGTHMKDAYSSKVAYINPNIKVPKAGDAFIMPIKGSPYGHTGLVTGVTQRKDGSFDVAVLDSNWVRSDAPQSQHERVMTHVINSKRIDGYYRPNNA